MSNNNHERVCIRCRYDGAHKVSPGKPPHGEQVRCGECDAFLGYLPKDKTRRKRPANDGHRAHWLERMGGELHCALCGGTESENRSVAFDMDHIWAVEDGGPERDEANIMPLCRDCHTIKNAVRALRRHGQGHSARREAS